MLALPALLLLFLPRHRPGLPSAGRGEGRQLLGRAGGRGARMGKAAAASPSQAVAQLICRGWRPERPGQPGAASRGAALCRRARGAAGPSPFTASRFCSTDPPFVSPLNGSPACPRPRF